MSKLITKKELITIDPYYNVQFYNECKEALKNNNTDFKEYISTKPPYNFFFEVEENPTFINYDSVAESYGKFLVNLIKPLRANEEYIYQRRESYTNIKAIKHYAINEPLKASEETGQGIFFTANKEEILRISKEFPRKIWFMGKYFNKKYRVFFTDNLLIKNWLNDEQILVEKRNVKNSLDLELELNFKIFKGKDRLEKLSETPYILKGQFYPVSIRPEITDKYII